MGHDLRHASTIEPRRISNTTAWKTANQPKDQWLIYFVMLKRMRKETGDILVAYVLMKLKCTKFINNS